MDKISITNSNHITFYTPEDGFGYIQLTSEEGKVICRSDKDKETVKKIFQIIVDNG